jgi:hypothetical protein
LLQVIEEQEQQKKFHDVEMEVSWGVGLKDMTEELVQKRLKERKSGLTPFEQYLEKRKAKRKQKEEVKKKSIRQVTTVVLVSIYCQVLCCLWVHYSPSCTLHFFTRSLSENSVLCFGM